LTHTAERPSGYEKKDLNIKKVVRYTVILVILLIIMLVLLEQWFMKTKEDLYKEMVLEPPNKELIQLRLKEESMLTTYGKPDSTGAYRIPIDSAIALIAAETTTGSQKK
jgi:hypothetical protein